MKFKNIFFIIILINSNFILAGTIRHDVPDEKYIEYGDKHKCVLKIELVNEKNERSLGSCVAIKDNWVVTAAHVVEDSEKGHVFLGEEKIEIEKVIKWPTFNGSFASTDIAICKLKKDLKLDAYPEIYDEEDELGKICSISGYGKTGTGLTGATRHSNKKRAGSNKVSATSDDYLYCMMDKNETTQLEFLISHGDSGGGLFIDGKLAGVNSSVMALDKIPDSNYGDESRHTRLKPCRNWILEKIRSN